MQLNATKSPEITNNYEPVVCHLIEASDLKVLVSQNTNKRIVLVWRIHL